MTEGQRPACRACGSCSPLPARNSLARRVRRSSGKADGVPRARQAEDRGAKTPESGLRQFVPLRKAALVAAAAVGPPPRPPFIVALEMRPAYHRDLTSKMSFPNPNARVDRATFDSENLIVHFTDGRVLYTPLSYFPRLLKATPEQRSNFVISDGASSPDGDRGSCSPLHRSALGSHQRRHQR